MEEVGAAVETNMLDRGTPVGSTHLQELDERLQAAVMLTGHV